MITAVARRQVPPRVPPAERLGGEKRIVLDDVSWDFYLTCCRELLGRRVRLTYDEGQLEILVTHSPHEFYKTMLAKLVENIVLAHDVPVRSGGSMTFQRRDLKRGFEPDECWWIAHEADVRGKRKLNFRKDPPPDLAVEVEITRSLVNRVGIYAAMKVPEIWRFNGTTLRFCILQAMTYADSETSAAFPFLRPEHLTPYLRIHDERDETTRIKEFLRWVRRRRR